MWFAWSGLRRRPARTALGGLGIGLATALVLALLSLSAGIEASAGRLAVESGVDLIATSANTTLTSAEFPPVVGAHQLPEGFARSDPNVASVSPWLVSDLVYANASLYEAANRSPSGVALPSGWQPTGAGSVGWIPANNAALQTPSIVSGRALSAPNDPHYANGSYRGPVVDEVVLDQGLAAVLHVGPGATVWASARSPAAPAELRGWFANATAFRVVGISGPFWLIPSALLGYFYLSELQSVIGGLAVTQDEASVVLVHLTDPGAPARDQSAIASAFPSLTVLTLGNVLGAVNHIVDLYRTFGTLIGAIGVAIAVLFTSTVLLMSVEDRSREIALLRAVGYSRRLIGGYVLEEALLLSTLGLVLGLPIGIGLGAGLNLALGRLVSSLPSGFSFVSFDASVLAGGLVEVLTIGVVAAGLPIVRALRLPIAEELRAP